MRLKKILKEQITKIIKIYDKNIFMIKTLFIYYIIMSYKLSDENKNLIVELTIDKIIDLNLKIEKINFNIIYFDIFLHISLILFILFSYFFVRYEYSKYRLPYKLKYPESKSQV